MIVNRTYVDLEGRKFSLTKIKQFLKKEAPEVFSRLTSKNSTGNDFWEALLNHKLPQVENTCKTCGSVTSFRKNGDYWGYSIYCTIQCAKADPEHMSKVKASYKRNPENQLVRQKIENTWLKNYGVKDIVQLPTIRKKIQKTLLRRYGARETFSSKIIQEKSRKTMLERYGVEFSSQKADFAEKVSATSLRRYGVTNPSKSEEIKKRIVQGNLRSLGVRYAMQNAESFLKQQHSAMSTKKLKLHGKVFTYRGYENYALKYLVNYLQVPVSRIHTGKNLPSISYDHKGKSRIYYPDIKVPGKLIEVKSTYTLGLLNDSPWFSNNIAKFKAARDSGHKIELWLVLPGKKRILRFARPESLTKSRVSKLVKRV